MQNEIMPADQKPRQGVRGYIMGKNLTVFRQAICGYFLFLAAQKGYAPLPHIPDGKGRILRKMHQDDFARFIHAFRPWMR